MKSGPILWLIAVLIGTAAMLGVEAAFSGVERNQLAPIAQGIGFAAAWLVAWPYAKQLRQLKSFLPYAMAGVVPALFIAAIRIAFRTG
jgi:hypothetical protein